MATQAAFAQTQTQGKSRTQVINELKQAQHDGIVPINKKQYPPTAEVVARNNDRTVLIEVEDRIDKVLYFEGELRYAEGIELLERPRWEAKKREIEAARDS